MARVSSKKTKARRNMYKAAGAASEGRRRQEDDMKETRKKGREEILQKKRGEASTSSATTQPVMILESLPQMVNGIMSEDQNLQMEAMASFRKLLSIGTSENTHVIIDNGVVPLFVKLLSSDSEDVREQAVWALGNVAGDSPKCRDFVLQCGAMNSVLDQFESASKASMLTIATRTLSNLCIGKPAPSFAQTKASLPTLARLLLIDNDELVTDACHAISYLSDGTNEQIQAVIDSHSGVVFRFVDLLEDSWPLTVQLLALRTIENIVTGDDNQTQAVLNHQRLLPRLLHILENADNMRTLKTTCRIISNITAGNVDQIQKVIRAGIFQQLIYLLQQGECEFEVKKEAVWAISNVTNGGNHDQIKFLESQGCIKVLCDFLSTFPYGQPQLIRITSQCLEKLHNTGGVGQVLDDSIYIGSQVDIFDDPRYECLLDPHRLTLKNLHAKTTKADIISFFKDKASVRRVTLHKPQNNTRTCIVEMESLAETRKAIKMNGEVVRVESSSVDLSRHVFLGRNCRRRTFFVSNFQLGLGKEATRKGLQKILGSHATIVGIFLPRELEFGYILVENWSRNFEDALARGAFNGIDVREAFLLPEFVDKLNSP